MRGRRPVVMCDGDDGECGDWDIDAYEETVDRIGDIKITHEHRALGWLSVNGADYCPEHAKEQS